MNFNNIKHLSTTTNNNSIITTVVDSYDNIYQNDSSNPGWVEISKEIKEVEIDPLELVNQRVDFDLPALKRAYIQGIISSQDLYATNPYSPNTEEFKLWFEGRAYALTS